jgi:hypothetical protein
MVEKDACDILKLSFMSNHVLYFSYWAINVVVLLVLSVFSGSNVLLGSMRLTMIEATVYAGFWLTVVVWGFWDLAIARGMKLANESKAYYYFLVVNLIGVWLVSRFSNWTGLFVESFSWALLLSVMINAGQRSVFRMTAGRG